MIGRSRGVQVGAPAPTCTPPGNSAGTDDWEVTMSKEQFFGVAWVGAGQIVGVGSPRSTHESALDQVKKVAHVDAEHYLVVRGHSKSDARDKAQSIIDAQVAKTDEFAPTEAELQEVASLRAVLEDPEAMSRAREPRTAPKTGTWYGCALDKDGEVMVTESAYSGPELAREGATATLPNQPHTVVAVQARSRDAALVTFDGLAPDQREALVGAEIAMARNYSGAAATPMLERRHYPVRSDVYWVTRTGTLHAKQECHFLRRSPAAGTLTGRPEAMEDILGDLVDLPGWMPGGYELFDDEGKVRVKSYCLYCAATSQHATV